MRALRWVGGSVVAVAALVAARVTGCAPSPGGPPAAPPPTAPAAPSSLALVVLGDSISVGFAACGRAAACEEESWATGDDPAVDSLRQRMAEDAGVDDVASTNLAVPGARAADVAAQAAGVDLPGEGLVAVLVGANDVCASGPARMTAPEDFRASVDRALAQVRERAPRAGVLVASVPDLAAVAAGLQGEEVAQETWARTGACPSVLGDSAPDPEVSRRVQDLNRELAQACAAVPGCTDDAGAVAAWRPALEDLSPLDAFHPSVSGQAQLAEALWPAAQRALDAGAQG